VATASGIGGTLYRSEDAIDAARNTTARDRISPRTWRIFVSESRFAVFSPLSPKDREKLRRRDQGDRAV